MSVLPECIYVHHSHAQCLRKEEEDTNDLKQEVIVSCQMGAGKQTLVLCKNRKCSFLLSQLSSTSFLLFIPSDPSLGEC